MSIEENKSNSSEMADYTFQAIDTSYQELVTSTSTRNLDQALSKAQGEFEPALKDSTNPHFKSRYADLGSTIGAMKAALSKYGLSVTQWPIKSDDDRLHLLTRLAFAGEFMQATFSAPVVKKDPQGYGSALTYLRRYTLQSILGIATEDDDGNQASQVPAAAPEVGGPPLLLFAQQFDAEARKINHPDVSAAIVPLVKSAVAKKDAAFLQNGAMILKKFVGAVNDTIDDNASADRVQDAVRFLKTKLGVTNE